MGRAKDLLLGRTTSLQIPLLKLQADILEERNKQIEQDLPSVSRTPNLQLGRNLPSRLEEQGKVVLDERGNRVLRSTDPLDIADFNQFNRIDTDVRELGTVNENPGPPRLTNPRTRPPAFDERGREIFVDPEPAAPILGQAPLAVGAKTKLGKRMEGLINQENRKRFKAGARVQEEFLLTAPNPDPFVRRDDDLKRARAGERKTTADDFLLRI